MAQKKSTKTPSISNEPVDWNKYAIVTSGSIKYDVKLKGSGKRCGKSFRLVMLKHKTKSQYLIRTEYGKSRSTDRMCSDFDEAKKKFAAIYKEKTKNEWGSKFKRVSSAKYVLAINGEDSTDEEPMMKNKQKETKAQKDLAKESDDDESDDEELFDELDTSDDEDSFDFEDLNSEGSEEDSLSAILKSEDGSINELDESLDIELSELDDNDSEGAMSELSKRFSFDSDLDSESKEVEKNKEEVTDESGINDENKGDVIERVISLATEISKLKKELKSITMFLSK